MNIAGNFGPYASNPPTFGNEVKTLIIVGKRRCKASLTICERHLKTSGDESGAQRLAALSCPSLISSTRRMVR
jgi:hypothetical protein